MRSLASEQTRWTLLGVVLITVCTTLHVLTVVAPAVFDEQEAWPSGLYGIVTELFNFARIRYRVFLCQLALWVVIPICLCLCLSIETFANCLPCSVELVCTIAMVYAVSIVTLGQTYHLTLLFGRDPDEVWNTPMSFSVEAWILLELELVIIGASLFQPLRATAFWVGPFVGVTTYFMMEFLCNKEAVDPQLPFKCSGLVAVSFLACSAALRTERHRRTEWRALQQIRQLAGMMEVLEQKLIEKEAQVQASQEWAECFQSVTSAFCDVVVQLSNDLRVCLSEPRHEAFFEGPIEGKEFALYLNTLDTLRFKDCVSRASCSPIPVSLPVTLRKLHTIDEVQLILIDRGEDEAGSGRPRYLMGICVEYDYPRSSWSKALLEALGAIKEVAVAGERSAAVGGPCDALSGSVAVSIVEPKCGQIEDDHWSAALVLGNLLQSGKVGKEGCCREGGPWPDPSAPVHSAGQVGPFFPKS